MNIQKLPPIEDGPRFDEHAHAGLKRHGTRPLEFSEIGRMQISTRGAHVIVKPPWAADTKKLQRIVCGMMHAMLVSRATEGFPQEEFDTDPLGLVLKLEGQLRARKSVSNPTANVQHAGIVRQRKFQKFGYAKLLSKVLYDSFCLGRASSAIAGDMRGVLTPVAVRQWRARANRLARVLFPGDSTPFSVHAGESARAEVQYRAAPRKKLPKGALPSEAECFQLSQTGRTATDIAKEYECGPGVIERKIRMGRRVAFGKQTPYRGHTSSDIPQMWRKGCTVDAIVIETGYTKEFVRCVLKSRGLEPRGIIEAHMEKIEANTPDQTVEQGLQEFTDAMLG